MATLRVSKSNGEWVVKESGSIVRRKPTKTQAINFMESRARPGDRKIIERANGTVMSDQEEQEARIINGELMDDGDDDSGGMFGSFF